MKGARGANGIARETNHSADIEAQATEIKLFVASE